MSPNEVTEKTQHIAQVNLINKLHQNPSRSEKIMVGEKVRVQVKPKSFIKGYRPKFSKQVYEVTEKGKGWYKTTKDDRKYLLSNLMKVDENELNPEKPDIEGTLEGHLKTLSGRKKPEYNLPEPEERINSKRVLRERKPQSQLEDVRYGRVRY
jgi:hypothetical protein